MARTIKSAKLDSPNARKAVAPGKRVQEPIGGNRNPGWFLCYKRRGDGKSGDWLAYWIDSADKKHRKMKAIGKADDKAKADNDLFLSYEQAKRKAAVWCRRATEHDPEAGGLLNLDEYTVGDAVREYFEDKAATGRRAKGIEVYKNIAATWIVPALGGIPIVKLTLNRVKAWRDAIARSPRRGNGQTNNLPPAKGSEAERKRKCTANRIVVVLKAVLNVAVRHNMDLARECMPFQWNYLEPFHGVERAREGQLSKGDRQKLIDAVRPDFRLLLQGALLSGARHGELRQLRCSDFRLMQDGGGYVSVRAETSKTGKGRAIYLSKAGTRFFVAQISGKTPNDLIFQRANGTPWPKGSQIKQMREACRAAGIVPRIVFHELRHVRMSQLANAGLEPELNALQAGHSNTKMGEQFYIHREASRVMARIEETGGEDDWLIVGRPESM
ncbi:MAG: tyrosine-type recombinase/integrase [Holophagaceae bacterium]|nr:tyrosine-type recombinase/integrase [Holophagaceae bacterium]